MSIEAMNWAYSQQVGKPVAKSVLVCLANMADQDGKCWPSITYISRRVEITERAVMQNIAKLIDGGFVERQRRGGEGEGRKTNIYRLQMGNVNHIHDGQREDRSKQREPTSPKQSINNQLSIYSEFMTLVDNSGAAAECKDWLSVLKKKKAADTKAAWQRRLATVQKLLAAGEDLRAVFVRSADSGWTGLFPLPANKGGPVPQDQDGLLRFAADHGLQARPGESMRDFRQRVDRAVRGH